MTIEFTVEFIGYYENNLFKTYNRELTLKQIYNFIRSKNISVNLVDPKVKDTTIQRKYYEITEEEVILLLQNNHNLDFEYISKIDNSYYWRKKVFIKNLCNYISLVFKTYDPNKINSEFGFIFYSQYEIDVKKIYKEWVKKGCPNKLNLEEEEKEEKEEKEKEEKEKEEEEEEENF